MESKESPILQGLNPAQRAAVVNYDAPSLIIAGAGSGKTRVLTSRIAYMIEQGVAPFNILALTFTNKAAEQMRERIAQMIPDNRSRYIRTGTFHSVFSRILRENADRIGFPDSFTIYEPSDCKNLLKTIVRELNLPDEKYKPNLLASRISYAKNCLVTPGAYLANSVYAAEDRQAQIPEFGNIYNIYCQRCKRNGAMDFDDLLLQTNILLRDAPDVLARYQEQFKYILVDEYQDTNYAQYVIIRRLSQLHSKVCVVGDDAQSIYSFRGAKIENILSFQKDFPDAMVFKLEQNYRSTRTIVDAANSVIVRNSKRMEKHCFSEGDKGEPIRILKAYTDREEAEMVVSDLRDKIRQTGDEWSEAVILYRTNSRAGGQPPPPGHPLPHLQGQFVLRPQGGQGHAGLYPAGYQSARRRGVQTHRQLSRARHRRHDRPAHRRAGRRARRLDVGGGRYAGRRTRCRSRAEDHRPQGVGFRRHDPRPVSGPQRKEPLRLWSGDRHPFGHHRRLPHREYP